MVDEATAIGIAQAFMYGRDLPFVQLDELPHRFGGERGAAPFGRLGQLSRRFLMSGSSRSVTGSVIMPPCIQ